MESADGSSVLFQNHIEEITLGIRVALSGSGILLNLLVIAATFKPNCKTNIKLVLSLSFADMTLAIFHLMFPFIVFETPWTNNVHVFTLDTGDGNKTGTGNFEIGLIGTPDVLGTNIGNSVSGISDPDDGELEINVLNSDLNNVSSDIKADIIEAIRNETRFQFGSNITLVGVESQSWSYEETVLQKFLSAFYLTPNIAGVLSMLLMTSALAITVTKPLKYNFLLSRKRVNILIVFIWLCSGFVSLALLVFKLTSESEYRIYYHKTNIVQIVAKIIWFATILVFVAIACMYVLIIFILKFKRLSSSYLNDTMLRRRANIRATMTAIAVTGSYAVCYLPFVWLAILQESKPYSVVENSFAWNEVMQILFILNTNLDAAIYAFRLPGVLNSLRNLFGKTLCYRK